MKLAIVGSRGIDDQMLFVHGLAEALADMKDPFFDEIVSGGARGVDAMAKRYAELHGYTYTEFPADWNRHGKKAAFLRNRDIVQYADHVLAIWDKESRGTAMVIDLCKRLGVPCTVVESS